MRKKPADTCIPHWVDYCMYRAVLHMSYVLLIWLIGGLYSIGDCNGRAFRFQGWGSWYAASLRPSDGKRAI